MTAVKKYNRKVLIIKCLNVYNVHYSVLFCQYLLMVMFLWQHKHNALVITTCYGDQSTLADADHVVTAD